MVSSSSHVFSNSTLVEVLDDLCVRFIINIPAEEICSVERVCFQVEEAQWYYEDFVRAHNPAFPTLNLRQFSARIFQHCPSLQEWKDQHEEAFAQFMAYKTRVPVRGAIMLNPDLDQCVLVRGMRSSASWSFPRGKINQDERDEDCAVREVLEETGFDASDMVQAEDFIEITMKNQNMKLYIIPGVPLDTVFEPRTRNEIGTIQWHNLSDLPTYSKKKANEGPVRMGKFYMVAPFINQLRKWISTKGMKWQAAQEELPNKENIAPVQPERTVNVPVEDGFISDSVPYEDSSAALRGLLGIEKPEPTVESNLEDPSLKLKNFLRLGGPTEGEVPKPSSEQERISNGQALLSILQNCPSQKASEPTPVAHQRTDPGPIRIMNRGQILETPTRPPAMPSPHSSLLHHTNYQRPTQPSGHRIPLSPLQHVRSLEQQSPSVFQQPPPPAPQFSPQPAIQTSPPTAANNQTKAPKAALTEQANALLMTLKSGPSQAKKPISATPSPMDAFFPPPQPHKAPDSQHSQSLLSILKGGPSSVPVPSAQLKQSPKSPNIKYATQIQRAPSSPTPMPSISHKNPPNQQEVSFRPSSIPPPRGPRTTAVQNATPKFAAANAYNAKRAQGDSPASSPDARTPGVGSAQPSPSLQKPKLPIYPQKSYNDYGLRGIQAQNSHVIPPPATTVAPSFDRRESVSSPHQQSLLSLLKSGNKTPTVVPAAFNGASESAIMSSPETSTAGVGKGKAKERIQPPPPPPPPPQQHQAPSFKMVTGGAGVAGAVAGGVGVPGKSMGMGMGMGGMGLGMSSRKSSGSSGSEAFLLSYLENVAKGAGK